MCKSRLTEPQTLKALREVETDCQVKDVCREYEISNVTYYNRKSKYGGMKGSGI